VDVEVSYDKEGKPKIGKKNFSWEGVNPVVNSIGGVGVNNPERMEIGAKRGSLEEISRARTSSTSLNLGSTV